MNARSTLVLAVIALGLSFAVVLAADPSHLADLVIARDQTPGKIKVKLEGVDETVNVVVAQDGTHLFELRTGDGVERLTPDQFAARVHKEQATRPLALKVLNVTSYAGIIWVVIGLGGQVLFTGRMVVQWMVSEKQKASIVPNIFWWMSLGGSTMLLIYFIWRKDIVGVLGQCTGWFIYVRNIVLIYRQPERRGGEEAEETPR